jgi:HSP20 family protein
MVASDVRGKGVTDRQLFERQGKGALMLMPFQPYRDLDRLAEEMSSQHRARLVPVDAYRRGNDLKVELDLPGADPGSIELTVENDVLSVKATRTSFRDKTDEVQIEERGHGQFGRQLFLGESLDRGHITAIYHDGVLTVTIPVAEQAKPHKIEVTHVGSVAQAVEAASIPT